MTTRIRSTPGACSNAATECSIIGRPASGSSCLGTGRPNRSPEPPASTTATVRMTRTLPAGRGRFACLAARRRILGGSRAGQGVSGWHGPGGGTLVIGHGAGRGRRTAAPPVHRHAAEGAGAGRRRDHDPGHRPAQPRRGRPDRGRGRRRLRGGARSRSAAAGLEQAHGVSSPWCTTTRPRSGTTPTRCGCAREHFAEGVLLVNGDTVHPVWVEKTLLAARGDGRTSCSPSTTSRRSPRRR